MYPYKSCLCTFWQCHPYFIRQFVFILALLLLLQVAHLGSSTACMHVASKSQRVPHECMHTAWYMYCISLDLNRSHCHFMIIESSPVDRGLSEGSGGDQCRLQCLQWMRRGSIVCIIYIPYVLFIHVCQVMLLLAREPDKSRSLESESTNDTKTGEQNIFGEIHTSRAFGKP